MSGFGTYGDLSRFVGTSQPDISGLPPWLQAQLQTEVGVDEGGTQTHSYNFNENPLGGFRGQDGKYYIQVGQNKLKDPKAFTTDAGLGDITLADNVIDPITPQGINYWMLAAALSAGALGTMAGVGAAADAGAGVAAGEGAAGAAAGGAGGAAGGGGLTAMNTGLSGLFAGEPALAPALANGGWEAALAGAGNFGPEAGGLLGGAGGGSSGGLLGGAGGGSGLTPLEGVNLQPETLFNTMNPDALALNGMPASQPWYTQALQGLMNNPMNAARLGMGLYSMVNANQGNVGGNGPAGGADPASIANAAGMQQFNPLQAAGQFQQNPYLLQQMRNVPFMGGSYGLGF